MEKSAHDRPGIPGNASLRAECMAGSPFCHRKQACRLHSGLVLKLQFLQYIIFILQELEFPDITPLRSSTSS